MKRFFLFYLFLITIQICTSQTNLYVSVSIPQQSGLASADFKTYRIKGDSLFVIYTPELFDTIGKGEILERYKINQKELKRLGDVISKTDSLGQHTALGTPFIMGWPRFLIYVNDNGRKMDGYVASVYRKHIYDIIDVLNEIYPKGKIISYDKDKLIEQEKRSEKEFYKEYNKSKDEGQNGRKKSK